MIYFCSFGGHPSWLTGLARTLDIGGTFDYQHPLPSAQCDWVSLASDLDTIRKDILAAVDHETADPRARLISDREMTKVRLRVVEQEIARRQQLMALKRRHYIRMLERLEMTEPSQAEAADNSRVEEELSWAR